MGNVLNGVRGFVYFLLPKINHKYKHNYDKLSLFLKQFILSCRLHIFLIIICVGIS